MHQKIIYRKVASSNVSGFVAPNMTIRICTFILLYPFFSEKVFIQMPIEPHLIYKHTQNPNFKLITRVNTRDFTVRSQNLYYWPERWFPNLKEKIVKGPGNTE